MVSTPAGDVIGEIALAIESGKTIHPHPRVVDSFGMALEVAHGSCTDSPLARK